MAIADPKFVAGDRSKLKLPAITGDGARPAIEFPANKWTLSIKGMNKDFSNMRDGRYRESGLEDASGSFELGYDTANDPTLVANGGLKAGAKLDAQFHLDETGTHFYALKIIIDDIGPASDFNGQLMFPVSFSLQRGTVTYPVYGS